MSADQQQPVTQMNRDELEHEVKELRELAGLVKLRGESEPGSARLEDIWIAGHPIGKMLSNTEERSRNNKEQIENAGGENSEAGMSQVVRERLLPIHQMWIDIREGNEAKVNGDSRRRGGRLFARFVRKAAGEHDTGVEASYGQYKMMSERARDILEDADDMTNSGKTMTVKRAMRAVQRFSKHESCDCNSLENCEHGLLVWHNDGGHKLVADKDEFNAAMEAVQDAINGEVNTPATDDEAQEMSASEDADGDDLFNDLADATAVTDDSDDSVKNDIEVTTDGGQP